MDGRSGPDRLGVVIAILAVEALSGMSILGPTITPLPPSADAVRLRTVDGVGLWDIQSSRTNADDIRRAADNPTVFTIVGLGDSIMYGVHQPKEKTYLEVSVSRAHLTTFLKGLFRDFRRTCSVAPCSSIGRRSISYVVASSTVGRRLK